MKKLTRILTAAALSVFFAPALFAQQPTTSPAASPTPAAQQSTEEAKRTLYTCYYNNYSSNPAEAYRCSQEYVQRFASDNDQYLTAIRQFITTFETGRVAAADNEVYTAINERRYADALRLGKVRMTARPDNLKMMINLAWAGLQATITPNSNLPAETTAEAIAYANNSIQAIQAGRTPEGQGAQAWLPFTGKDDALGWLNYAAGTMNLRTNPTEAANYYRRAAGIEGGAKREPTTYSYLAFAYNTEYTRLRDA